MYVSIEFESIDDWKKSTKYVVEAILMKKENRRLPFYCAYTKTGDWIIYDTFPQCILTEKLNVTIYQYIKRTATIKKSCLFKLYISETKRRDLEICPSLPLLMRCTRYS